MAVGSENLHTIPGARPNPPAHVTFDPIGKSGCDCEKERTTSHSIRGGHVENGDGTWILTLANVADVELRFIRRKANAVGPGHIGDNLQDGGITVGLKKAIDEKARLKSLWD